MKCFVLLLLWVRQLVWVKGDGASINFSAIKLYRTNFQNVCNLKFNATGSVTVIEFLVFRGVIEYLSYQNLVRQANKLPLTLSLSFVKNTSPTQQTSCRTFKHFII